MQCMLYNYIMSAKVNGSLITLFMLCAQGLPLMCKQSQHLVKGIIQQQGHGEYICLHEEVACLHCMMK